MRSTTKSKHKPVCWPVGDLVVALAEILEELLDDGLGLLGREVRFARGHYAAVGVRWE